MPLGPHQLPWTGTGLIRVDSDGYVKIFDPSTGQAVATFDSANGISVTNINLAGGNPTGGAVLDIGTGDDLAYGSAGGSPWLQDNRQGTGAIPIAVGSGPVFKISRTESIPAATMPGGNGANNEGNAGIWVAALGDQNNQAQVSAILGTSINASTQARTANAINIDATAIQGFGKISAGGTGNGIGGYFEGRTDSAVAGSGANGLEIRVNGNTGADGVYNPTAFSGTVGAWITSGSATVGRVNALAIGVALVNGCQWDTGIGFQTIGGVSAVKTTSISDDSSSTTSLAINGTHTAAIRVASGAGPVMIGEVALNQATALFEIANGTSAHDPLVSIFSSNSSSYSFRFASSTGSFKFFMAGAGNSFFNGTVAGDGGLQIGGTGNSFHIGGTTRVMTIDRGNQLSFFAKATVAQQTALGTTTGFVAGAGTAMNSASTSTGGSGASAYTYGDVVLALKNYGLLAA